MDERESIEALGGAGRRENTTRAEHGGPARRGTQLCWAYGYAVWTYRGSA